MSGPESGQEHAGAGPAWWIYRGDGVPPEQGRIVELPDPPPWRMFRGGPAQPPPDPDDDGADRKLGRPAPWWGRPAGRNECDMVNAALRLRRPLLVTGPPGAGKSSLAYRIARELGLGRVLTWAVTSRGTLKSGLYDYDAIGRAQDAASARAEHRSVASANSAQPVAQDGPPGAGLGDFVRLGPLGTALLPHVRPRMLLIDELDKSDIDLPNDLLHIFEDGEYSIPELVRARQRHPVVEVYTDDPDRVARIDSGRVQCLAFPVIVITSNGEREFPPAFLRRCLPLELPPPDADDLAAMVHAQFPQLATDPGALIQDFLARAQRGPLARDQLLNALHLITAGAYAEDLEAQQSLIDSVLHVLASQWPP
ncbi:AAA family ATPase [Actinospica robiniae]|uniref:AAA family ATPase n=1 Tax=Actinospica robiniae TaxID=304901 RepID=UPI00040A6347|nr:MoxR family ATPase [Actinospica robiniae]